MMLQNDFYDQVVRRITRIIFALALLGAAAFTLVKGIRDGFAFLTGSAISYVSFLGWRHLVDAVSPSGTKRSSTLFVMRTIALVALAYVIIRFLGLNARAALLGLLVSGAAVILELIYELIYART